MNLTLDERTKVFDRVCRLVEFVAKRGWEARAPQNPECLGSPLSPPAAIGAKRHLVSIPGCGAFTPICRGWKSAA